MGKKHKKKRTKLERSIDHRNYGFDAVDALFEHNAEHSKNIYPPIITKVGLKDYSKKELEERAGKVVEYNYNNRYSWEEFKNMPERNRQEYLKHLTQKYKGITLADLAMMFNLKKPDPLSKIARTVGVTFPKGRARNTDGRKAFKRDMLNAEVAVPEVTPIVEEPVTEPAVEPEVEQTAVSESSFTIKEMQFVCKAEHVSDVLDLFGFTGDVLIKVESCDGKEVVV